ncbi:MAG: type citrate synthase [Geobacteraceae bacterium]|jgi:citrate synthase|nr:type citrate synthase [Geobacteraceae bacterium]
MKSLKEKLFEKIQAHRSRTAKLLKDHKDVVIDQVTIGQCIGGVRNVKCLVTDISYLDPYDGIRFRGKTVTEVFSDLPHVPNCQYPYVEGFWYFLLTGEVPTMMETLAVVEDFSARALVPQYVFDILRTMPRDTHPMTMLSAAVLAMQRESIFAKKYAQGVSKYDYWEPMYEDCTNIIAKLPAIAAYIYRMKYKSDVIIQPGKYMDMGAEFAHMMGIPRPYDDAARMTFILHSDHESGNISSHTTHLVASGLADAYYSLSSGFNGLSGPLHGLANQEVLRWIQDVLHKLGGKIPTEEDLKAFIWETLNSGHVIPGYGHAILRRTDPRFTAQMEFCQRHMPDYELFRIVSMIYRVAPGILMEYGKVKNPWPNLDAHSGVIHWYFGITDYDFYTVLFAVGRALGVLANITWDRALGYPIERPKSVSTGMLEEFASQAAR